MIQPFDPSNDFGFVGLSVVASVKARLGSG